MAAGAASVADLVRRHAHDNSIVATFTNAMQFHVTRNWVEHLQKLNLRGILVGVMNVKDTDPNYQAFRNELIQNNVGVYTVNSPQVALNPQGGRWFHVLPLLQTGVRLLLSDSDAVWLRDPFPYLKALEARHPSLDVAVSTDAQEGTDALYFDPSFPDRMNIDYGRLGMKTGKNHRRGGRSGRRRRRGDFASANLGAGLTLELDLEEAGHCGQSMNIGIMAFPPGARPGSLRLMQEAMAHLSESGNLRRVDQGPLNYRWKHGSKDWRWAHQMAEVRDKAGGRLCSLVNDTVIGGVLPIAQFGNTLTHSVLKLWKFEKVRPYAVHATWMRSQDIDYKIMRLREAKLWADLPTWYSADAFDTSKLGPSDPAAGYITFDLHVPKPLLTTPRIRRGALPIHHLRLMKHQLQQLRSAFFIARTLNRALVLPRAWCSCELGFWPSHIGESCIADNHRTLTLPYVCAIDHYLNPTKLAISHFHHRERTFLGNERTPTNELQSKSIIVHAALSDDDTNYSSGENGRVVTIRRHPSYSQLLTSLGRHPARILHFANVTESFGAFDFSEMSIAWHEELQGLLSSWCCTSDVAFKRSGGTVRYLLPPLPGQTAWTGSSGLTWVAERLVREGL